MTPIRVTKDLSVVPLVVITDPEFGRQYSLGVWWALYGDEQGRGRYDDQYLLGNVATLMQRGFSLSQLGFYLGMIHGGNIDPVSLQQKESVISTLSSAVR